LAERSGSGLREQTVYPGDPLNLIRLVPAQGAKLLKRHVPEFPGVAFFVFYPT